MIEFVSADIGSTATDKYPLELAIERARRTVETYEQKLASAQGDLKYVEEQLEKWKAQNQRIPQIGEFWRTTRGRIQRIGVIKSDSDHIECAGRLYIDFNNDYRETVGSTPWVWLEFVAPARKDNEFKVGDVVEFWGVRCVVRNVFNVSLLEIGKLEGVTRFIVVYTDDCKLITPVEMQ